MPRKKTTPDPEVLAPQQFSLMDALDSMAQDMAVEVPEAMLAAMEFEKHLLDLAHTIAREAIRVGEPETEAERVAAAERQVRFLGKLFRELHQVTQS
ncbi:hypothetical protein [Deinococcus hopiensis]|uniref:Uncharacterized protein n=1 Tax=Deinococcus hopiensis KR-140 TaxID=695939 RepID=A0A1W1UKU9_9DEIO|nr:hypothetical protein [Deinococcus hopiensis]SMB81421.1 hypothetical protein SAMN00790413_04575 [Deinococcus hopiensis KR-140]